MALDFSRCRPVRLPDGSESPPFQHVLDGVEWLVAKREPYALLANDMGGSKSAQAIIAAQFLFEQGKIDRVIVISPASVRPRVWYDETLGQLGEHLWDDLPSLVSDYRTKIRQWSRGPEGPRRLRWICANYEWLRSEARLQTLFKYCGPKTLLLLDESSAVKGAESSQTNACMRLRWLLGPRKKSWRLGYPRCGYCWLMNGTPLADGPEDLFSQGNLMHPSIHDCQFITHFRNKFGLPEIVRGTHGFPLLNPKSGKPLEQTKTWPGLPALLAGFAPHVLRQDWRANADIPPAMPVEVLTVRLTDPTWKTYRNMRDDMVHWLESGDVAVSRHAATKVLRLAQITSGILGGIEKGESEVEDGLFDSLDGLISPSSGDGPTPDGDVAADRTSSEVSLLDVDADRPVDPHAPVFIGREKLDFLLDWQADRLHENPALKLLVWAKFVPELRRYLAEARALFQHEVGAVCGQSLLGDSVKQEREHAERLLDPRTSPPGPLTVGGTFGSGGLGLNFTAFHVTFNLSQVYEDWKRRQADKRVDRPGQREPVVQFDLIAEGPRGQRTIDHVISKARREKQNLNEWSAAQWVRALKEE